MKIAVVGAGAMGSIYAGLLSEAGHAVWAVDPNSAHVAAINANGLSLTGPDGTRLFRRIKAVGTAADIGEVVDLVVLATKAAHVPAATQSLGPVLGPETTILAMQNGLGAAERVRQNLPDAGSSARQRRRLCMSLWAWPRASARRCVAPASSRLPTCV